MVLLSTVVSKWGRPTTCASDHQFVLLGIKTLDSFNEAGLVQPRILKPAPYGTGFKIVFGYALGFKFIALKVSENSQQSLNFRKLWVTIYPQE